MRYDKLTRNTKMVKVKKEANVAIENETMKLY